MPTDGWARADDVAAGMYDDEKDTAKQKQIVADMVEVARAWQRGEIPLQTAIELTLDGWMRAKVTQRVTKDKETRAMWFAFLDEIITLNDADCDFGGIVVQGDGKLIRIPKQQVVDSGGWLEREADPESGEIRCMVKFPRLNLEAPPRRDVGLATAPGSMAEWNE